MNKRQHPPWKVEDILYLIFGTLLIAGLMAYGFMSYKGVTWRDFPPCLLREHTGWYCPGCGATRALIFLLKGNILQSLLYHPVVVYGVVVGTIFMVSHTLRYLTRGRVHGMTFYPAYALIAIGLLLASFIVKNVLRLLWGIDIIP